MVIENTDDYLSIFLQDIPLLDVRAPVEFERGAFEHAINIPLMTDEERHQIGICYKQSGQDAAIALGRKIVTEIKQQERTEQWINFTKQNPHGLLYCFRGGLRSRITQTWIEERGVDYPYIEGGYKALRRFLIDQLSALTETTSFILISGRTGTGKTQLLNRIPRSIDLEGLANHRGSAFGFRANEQPTPINFENTLSIRLLKHRHNQEQKNNPIFLEGEGRLIGKLTLPEILWQKMRISETLVLETPIEQRIDIGIQDYVVNLLNGIELNYTGIDQKQNAFAEFSDRHYTSLNNIKRRFGAERHNQATDFLKEALANHQQHNNTEAYRPFIKLLLEQYYDPMYDYQLSKREPKVLARGNQQELAHWLTQQGIELL